MDTIFKVCNKDIIPKPKLIEYSGNDSSPDAIVSAIMKRAEDICKKVCTFEGDNQNRKG